MENTLVKNLIATGLSDKESLLLSAVMTSAGDSSLSSLEKITGLPQTTISRNITSLVEKGLLVWQLGTQGKTVALGDFATFIQDLKIKQTDIEATIQALSQNSVVNKVERPVVKYYEGVEGIRQLIWNTLAAKTEVLVYTNIMRQEVIGKKWLTDYCLDFINKGLKDRVLCDLDYAKYSYQKYGGRQAYFAPVEKFYLTSKERVLKSPVMKIKGETYIYNDIFASYSLEGDILVGSEIESKDIVDTQKSIFENLWAQTSEQDSIENYL